MQEIKFYPKRLITVVAVHVLINLFILVSVDKYTAWNFGLAVTFLGWIYSSLVTVVFIKILPKAEHVTLGKKLLAWFAITASVYWTLPILDQFAVMKLNF